MAQKPVDGSLELPGGGVPGLGALATAAAAAGFAMAAWPEPAAEDVAPATGVLDAIGFAEGSTGVGADADSFSA